MEVGHFAHVDFNLVEAKNILRTQEKELAARSEERRLFYWGKYFHLQGKNDWRALYHQRAYERFKEGILYFSKY